MHESCIDFDEIESSAQRMGARESIIEQGPVRQRQNRPKLTSHVGSRCFVQPSMIDRVADVVL